MHSSTATASAAVKSAVAGNTKPPPSSAAPPPDPGRVLRHDAFAPPLTPRAGGVASARHPLAWQRPLPRAAFAWLRLRRLLVDPSWVIGCHGAPCAGGLGGAAHCSGSGDMSNAGGSDNDCSDSSPGSLTQESVGAVGRRLSGASSPGLRGCYDDSGPVARHELRH